MLRHIVWRRDTCWARCGLNVWVCAQHAGLWWSINTHTHLLMRILFMSCCCCSLRPPKMALLILQLCYRGRSGESPGAGGSEGWLWPSWSSLTSSPCIFLSVCPRFQGFTRLIVMLANGDSVCESFFLSATDAFMCSQVMEISTSVLRNPSDVCICVSVCVCVASYPPSQ